MPRYRALMNYWDKMPPTHLMVRLIAMWTGAYKPPKPEDEKIKVESLEELRAFFPTGNIRA